MASGITKTGIERPVVAVIGDSTFFHNGLLGLVNAAYNQSNITVVLCDKHYSDDRFQPHAGSGEDIQGECTGAIA